MSADAPPAASLRFEGARLDVRLGWEATERAQPQPVELAVEVHFARRPAACETDRLDDTVCYDDLIARARARVSDREFRLLEHLAWVLAEELRPCLPDDATLELAVTKLHPPVPGLDRGVLFRLRG